MKVHPSFTWFIFIVHLIVCNAWKSWVSTKNVLVIELEKETDPVFPVDLNYTGYKYIELQNPKLNVLTTEMQSTISTMANFSAFHGSINSVHLMAQFKKVNFVNCSLQNFIINPTGNFQTEFLGLKNNLLQEIPKHLNLLSNLEKLYLYDNKIEFVEMAEFNGLNKLKLLALQRNKITEIRATLQKPVILPKLEKIFIDNNHLTDISFKHWNTSNLNLINLQENQLQIALSLPGKLNGLKGVALATNPLNCEWLNSTLKQLKDRNLTVYDGHITKCNATGPELNEIVRRVNFKETFATLPLLQHSQIELKEALENKLKNLEEIDRNVLTQIEQLKQQNQSLYNNFKKHEVKLIELSVNTTLKLEKLQTETRNKFANIDKANVENDQQLKKMLNNLENSIKLKILNNAKAINSTNLERNKNYNLLQTKDEELEDQIKAFSTKTEDLQTELANVTLQLESLQNSILNETESLELHQEQELMKLRQQISRLENERKADHQQFKQMFEVLQNHSNASSIGPDDSAYGGIFKLERYSAILVVLGVFGFLYLIKMILNLVKCRKSAEKGDICMSEVPIASFMDDPQQTREHIYAKNLSHHL